jgi:hypothetical protein
MPTAPPPPARARARARRDAGPTRLLLAIGDRLYQVRRVGCDAAVGVRAFRLLSDAGDLYDVLEHRRHGPSCDCPDFIFRRDGLDPEGCKHVRALAGCGLIRGAPALAAAAGGR